MQDKTNHNISGDQTSQVDKVSFSSEMACEILQRLRTDKPKVHCLTNAVAQHWTANVLLALGAQPAMSWAQDELPDFIGAADALLINLGTLETARHSAAQAAADLANQNNVPFVLDPVYAERSPKRLQLARAILAAHPAILRGNDHELRALQDVTGPIVTARTGAVDEISDGRSTLRIANGVAHMGRITAMGCALGAVSAACASVTATPLEAAASACLIFGVAGELADERSDGPGSFGPAFLDALFFLNAEHIKQRAKLELSL